MKARWKRLMLEITVWLVAEIVLNLLGLDNLADYSEFIFQSKFLLVSNSLELSTTITAGSHCLNT